MNAKARNKAIYELIKNFKNNTDTVSELSITELSNGFISQDNQILFDELYNKYYNESYIDTDYDKSLFSSFFYTQNNKILGTENTGSGFINPIKTIGKIEDLNTLIPFEIKPIKHIEHKIEKSENSTDFKKETIANSFVTQSSTDILSIEDSLKIYSPTITNAEIKGFVYYKQKFGSPMYGWEKWFLVDDKVGKLAYSTDSFHLKDENMLDIKKVPSNTLLGVKTEITKDVDGDLYYGIKSENKEIYYVLEDCFIEQDSYSITDTDKLDDLVKEKGLCFDSNDYVPVYMYTFGDIYELKEKLVGKYDSVNDIFIKGYKDLLIQKFGIDIANWHEELIETAIANKNNFDFANPIALERPYLSKENELSHSFMINELDIDCGVSIKKHHDELDSNKVWKNKVRYSEANRISLFKAYEIWFAYNVTDNMLEKTTSYDVKNLYFKNGVVYLSEAMQEKSKKEQDTEKDERRILAKLEGDRFYSEFLATALIQNDLLALNRTFNKMYNNFVNYDLDKVPVGFEANKKIFNLDNFKLKSVQRNGLAFLNINNSGCLAYDVGFGKGHLLTSNILTPNGYVKMGDIKLGSLVIGKNGKSTQVTGVYPLGKVQCYKVTFSDGSFTEVSDEHLWNVQENNSGRWETVKTKDIKDNLFNSRDEYRYLIPMVDAVEFNEVEVDNPYLLGSRFMYSIPDEYKFNTVDVRLDVLRGILDNSSLNIDSYGIIKIDFNLCSDLKFLCQSLGGVVTEIGQYTVLLNLPKDITPFLNNKTYLDTYLNSKRIQPTRYISSIKDIGFQEAQCIRVDAEDHLYVCDDFIVTHNTLTAIHNLAILLKQGSIKRPLIAVPKTVYKNWICEMFGFWTNGSIKSLEQFNDSYFVNGALTGTKYKLNDWYNLRGNKKPDNSEIDEYTITLVTYQGLELIGFSEDLYSEMNEDLFEILNVKTDSQTDRDIEKLREQNETLVGKALTKTEFDIDILGFDYLVLDEAHSFKNIFTSFAIPTEFRDSWRMTKGTQSLRALKAFSLSLYIQKKYNGNVNILTATPFTNSPLELYSMLSLVGYNYLVNSNINNLFKFMSLFIETQVEYTVDHLQNIVLNTVIKSFKNKNILRDVLYRFFDYQDNPIDSGIKRPNKINFPNSAVSTYLEMSELQITAQGLVVDEANNYSADNKGAMGRALSWAKSNAFSPYLLPDIEKYSNIDTFIENSPKLKYTIECIKSVKKHHESIGQECSGQVIYSNRGKVLFQDFKKAIEKECRFVKRIKFGDSYVDEVEVIIASTSDSDAERKELIKDAFNSGVVKVIIGTATIQEGINLQKTGTCLYNLDLDWNPTSFKQLEGRIHRQGNKFKNVRIVVPMVQGTLDSFINQKLDEKSKRIASIWDKNHNVNNYVVTDALDPMEIKFNLINDAEQLLKMKLDIVTEQAKKEFMLCKDKMDTFEILEGVLKTFFNTKNRVLPLIEKTVENYKRYLILLEKYEIADNKYYSSNKSNIEYVINNINEILKMYDDFVSNNNWRALFDFRRACTVRKFYAKVKDVKGNESEVNYKNIYSPYKYVSLNEFGEYDFENIVTQYRKCKRLEKIILKPYGVSFFDNIASIKSEYLNNFNKAKAELESLKTDDFKKVIHDEICLELEKRQEGIGSLHDRVTAFAETNNLLC